MPTSSIDNTMPKAAGASFHALTIAGDAKLTDSTSLAQLSIGRVKSSGRQCPAAVKTSGFCIAALPQGDKLFAKEFIGRKKDGGPFIFGGHTGQPRIPVDIQDMCYEKYAVFHALGATTIPCLSLCAHPPTENEPGAGNIPARSPQPSATEMLT